MRSKYGQIVTALYIVEAAASFEAAMIYAALPTLIREFGDPMTAGWLVTSYLLIGAVAALVAGRLGDIYGRHRVLLLLVAGAAIGSAISAVTSHFWVVLIGRGLQGLAVAVLPLTIGIIRESLPDDRVPVAVGLMTSAQILGSAVGLVLGGLIIDNLNWHSLFALSAGMLAISWVLVRGWVPSRPGSSPSQPIDWLEGLLPAPAIMAILLGISLSNSQGWGSEFVWISMGIGVVILALWARRSLASKEPFIDLRLLGSRNIALANLLQAFLALGTMQVMLIFSTYTQAPLWTLAGLGLSATLAGFVSVPSNFLATFVGPFAGWTTQRFGFRVSFVLGGMVAIAGWLVTLNMPQSVAGVIALLCAISFGGVMLMATVSMAVVASVAPARTGEAIGAMQVIRATAMSIGTQVVAGLLAVDTVVGPSGKGGFPSATSYRYAIVYIIVLALFATICGLLMSFRRSRSDEAVSAA